MLEKLYITQAFTYENGTAGRSCSFIGLLCAGMILTAHYSLGGSCKGKTTWMEKGKMENI